MQTTEKQRTPESIRAEALEHFNWRVSHAALIEREVADAEADRELGMAMIDAVLALDVGELFNVDALLPADLDKTEKFALSFRVLPYVSGYSLRILSMKFVNKDIGEVPLDIVRALLDGAPSQEHNGVTITPGDVALEYRRLPLN